MKKEFHQYYKPSKSSFTKMHKNAIFIFDANILLNLYRTSANTSNEFLHFLEKNKDRIWIPHQFALEFHRNRLGVICSQESDYVRIFKQLNDFKIQINAELENFKRHILLETNEYIEDISTTIEDIISKIEQKKKEHPNLLEKDKMLDTISILFKDKVGKPFSENDLQELYKTAKVRFEQQLPPGYLDLKDKENAYGDFIGWVQIKNYAKITKKPIILVTGERKADWWQIANGKKIGPRYELLHEIFEETGVKFWMYTMEKFSEIEKFNEETTREILTLTTTNAEINVTSISKKEISKTSKNLNAKVSKTENIQKI